MNNLAPDQLVRDIAIDYKQSFIVQAPAGAGKTSLLTQRILNLLTIVENPEEIVAVTFTRKAAAEMRHRLLETLLQASDPEPEATHEKRSWQLAKQVLERDTEKQWQLLKNSHRLRILTIDSLSSLIANQMPLVSNLGGSLGIAEFPQESYHQAAKAVLNYLNDSDYSDDLVVLLEHLDNQVERLIGLLAKMLAKRDQWLRLLGAGELDIALLQQGITAVANLRLQKLSEFSDFLEDSCLLPALLFAAAHIDAEHPLSALRKIEFLPDFDAENLNQWKAIADFCLTASGTFRKALNKNQGLLADNDLEGENKVRGKQVKANLKKLFESWSEIKGFAEALKDINDFPLADYSNEQQKLLSSLLKLLRLATIELNVNFQARSEADFIEVALAADRALGYFDEPSELALKLDYQISHILVDEFQDTSFTQYRLLEKMIAGWQQGDGRTLFLVGDPMQSIYRFREANVGLFIKTQQEGIGDIAIEPLTLTANFRSSASIIEWVNDTFEQVFPEDNDALLGAVSYSSAVAMKPSEHNDGVNFMPTFDCSEQSEAVTIAKEIQQLKKQNPKQSIAILVRGRSHAEPIATALSEHSINFYAQDMQLLRYKAVIGDLISMARFLLQPNDAIGFFALLKSPYVGLSLTDISLLQRQFGLQYPRYLTHYEQVDGLSEKARSLLEATSDKIIHAMYRVGREPLSQVLENLWLILGGPSALLSDRHIHQAEALFNVLVELEQTRNIITIEVIEQALLTLYAKQQKVEFDVEIMTMHKSKGLEFDTVFLPSLERRKKSDAHQLLLWEEFSSGYEQHYLLAPIQAQETKEPIYQLARSIQSKKAHFEDARLLYVAATRAKKRLYLSCELKVKFSDKKAEWEHAAIAKQSLLNYLKPFYENAISKSFSELDIESIEDDERNYVPSKWYRLDSEYQVQNINNAINLELERKEDKTIEIDFDWASDAARIAGLVLHEVLESVAKQRTTFNSIEENGFSSMLSQLNELIPDENDREKALDKIKKAVKLMQQDTTLAWILADHKEAECEWALSHLVTEQKNGEKGEPKIFNMIVDRTFVDEKNVRWIIDYKTGEHLGADLEGFITSEKERYKPQLDKYEAAIQKLDSRPIKKALYYPMHQKLVEVE